MAQPAGPPTGGGQHGVKLDAPHEVPSELRTPPPRKVRYKTRGDAVALWFMRLFFIPLVYLPFPLISWTTTSFAFLFGAEEIKARVTLLKRTDRARMEGSLHYEYVDAAGALRIGTTGLRHGEFQEWEAKLAGRERGRPAPGEPDLRPEVWVRAVDIGPIHYSKALGVEVTYWCGTAPASCLLAAMVLGWMFAFAAVIVGAVVEPWMQRRLIRLGVAAPGRVVRRSGEGPPTESFVVEYEMQGERGPVAGRMRVDPSHQSHTAPGMGVTVLYDPRKPSRNLVYEFCQFFAAG